MLGAGWTEVVALAAAFAIAVLATPTGVSLGVGGLAGAYCGARIQRRLPDAAIRRVTGILVIAIGAHYLWSRIG